MPLPSDESVTGNRVDHPRLSRRPRSGPVVDPPAYGPSHVR
jgi:hypothetical protein